ncbi:hypothetical protein KCU65_g436, partial [Aureobasidium melanogenum]
LSFSSSLPLNPHRSTPTKGFFATYSWGFKAFRLSSRRLSYGTFPDLLKRGSREKRIYLDHSELARMIRLLEDQTFASNIDAILRSATPTQRVNQLTLGPTEPVCFSKIFCSPTYIILKIASAVLLSCTLSV